MSRRLRQICWSAVLFTLVATACSNDEPRLPDVILISIDTLRADSTGTYGSERALTPRIDEFARGAWVLDRSYTPSSHTLAAHTSLLTGLEPDAHGVNDHEDALGAGVTTLAELLEHRGYRTGAFVNGGFLDPKFGLGRGFGTYSSSQPLELRGTGDRSRFGRDASETNDDALAWLDEDDPRPAFLFVHYFDAHSDWRRLPYDAPPDYLERFALEEPSGFSPEQDGSLASGRLLAMNQRAIQYSEAERSYVRSLYDAGVAYTDSQVGALLDALRHRDRFDNALVVLISDHGEEFQEHGMLLHEQVFEELVRVPLVISFPESVVDGDPSSRFGSWRGVRSDALVQLTDVAPTVLDALGYEWPKQFRGHSLLPLTHGEPAGREYVYFRNRTATQRGIGDGRWKLVHRVDEGRSLLFDLRGDPGEERDVSDEQSAVTERLFSQLTRRHKHARRVGKDASHSSVLDEGKRQALEALGYAVD